MSTYHRAPPTGPGLRLHLNENNAGCSPAVLQALASLTPDQIACYPDYQQTTARVAEFLGVAPDWVLLTNGLDEGISLVCQHAGSGVGIVSEPAFEMYAATIETFGGTVTRVLPREDFAFSVDDLLAASEQARLVFLTDPNNPTGVGLPGGAIASLAAARPNATVFVDEAYADFSSRTLIGSALEQHRNLIVGRTFAKGHGLAALRIGALVAHPDTLAPLAALQPPYSLNVAALAAVEAAVADTRWLASCVEESNASKQGIYEYCDARGLKYWRSEANFVLVRVGSSATAIVDALAAQRIFIRDKSTAPGCDGCVRITAGMLAYTQRALMALEAALATRGR
jgi:histidinol-phosphate aminotransferase